MNQSVHDALIYGLGGYKMSLSTVSYKVGDIIKDTNWNYEGEVVEVLSKDYRIKTASKIFHLIPHEDAVLVYPALPSGSLTSPGMAAIQNWNSPSGAKFKVNDSVRNKVTGAKGEIRSVDELVIDDYTYWTWYPDESIARYTKEADLELVMPSKKNNWGPKCECGSDSTPGYEGLHSSWCPKNGRG